MKFYSRHIKKLFELFYTKIYQFNKKRTKEDIISYYNIIDLKNKKELFLRDDMTESEINNFIYINQNAKITIRAFSVPTTESVYLQNLLRYFKILETHQRPYNITIHIENRELLNQSKLLDQIKNINLTIYNNYTEYTKEEYLNNEEKLDKIIKPIKESNLTTYEKYLATYNLVKQFKQYKENENEPMQSRSLKYILNNDYMVCVGYADLLKTLLDKLNIPSISISVNIDSVKRENKDDELIPSNLSGHQRNIVKIDDDKYNIHGIYIADPTFDNDLELDMYVHSSITFDTQKESSILEGLEDEDLIFDFHNFQEFNEKINYYLKREINNSNKDTYQEKVIYEYLFLYYQIIELLIKLDYSKYQELSMKYNNQIKNIIKQFEINKNNNFISLNNIEKIFSDFLTEYANYIIPLSNQKIDKDKLSEAAYNVKKYIDGYNDQELKEWYEQTDEINQEYENIRYPYIYNPQEVRINYLELKKKKLTKNK